MAPMVHGRLKGVVDGGASPIGSGANQHPTPPVKKSITERSKAGFRARGQRKGMSNQSKSLTQILFT